MQKRFLNVLIVIIFLSAGILHAQTNDRKVTVHLRGVYESKISILPLIGPNAFKTIVTADGLKNGGSATVSVSADELPAEFVLRFDYKDKVNSTPYPSEKRIFISDQDLELWINPPYCNNSDSAWFQKDEKENMAFLNFSVENGRRKEKLGLLQNFLMNYDDPKSKFYKLGIDEFETRRSEYNNWIGKQSELNKSLFVGHTFQFQYIPENDFEGNEAVRLQSMITHYFDGIDFKDQLLTHTTDLKGFMDAYVNIYGTLALTEALRDSLFTLAGQRAIDKASAGDPKVYGWMVDYFYKGYESFGIEPGMKMLQAHLENPNCLTTKRQQILKRVEGMTKLVPGALSPGFILKDADSNNFDFHAYKGTSKYKLLLFWSADCEHCMALVKSLSEWYNEAGNKDKISIIAVSLDDTDTEVEKWKKAIPTLAGWKHLRAKGGVNAAIANDYAILSTPVMFLVESQSNLIYGIPDGLDDLITLLRK